ncbi:conserved membrane hypothetical protein [Candidatus Zixiibacteriota bacterium]|nr:conserved membrane hypothetical protein [candidate division Zixibacteria bacterium]
MKSLLFILLFLVTPLIFHPVPVRADVTNSQCPVLTDETVDPSIYTDYQGKRIYFCCNKCRREFLENPQKYLARLPQFAAINGTAEDSAIVAGNNNTTNNGAGADNSEFNLVRFIGKFHPVMVHFPIALTFAALFFALVSLFSGNIFYDHLSVPLSYLGAAAAIVTVFLGLAAGFDARYPAELARYFDWHRIFGISSEVMTIFAAVLGQYYRHNQWKKGRKWYYSALILTVVLIGITGHLGATLVYGPDHFSFK